MARSRWGEIGDHYSRADAEEQIAKARASSKGCKFRLREERRQARWSSYGERGGETRFVVYQLCPGVY